MAIDSETIKSLIDSELASVSDALVVQHIRGILVEPYVLLHDWDYGERGQQYPCWMVLEDPATGAEIGYCEYGFGPKWPWGLLGPGSGRSMGSNNNWYQTFLEPFFESFASTTLPIWRVFRIESDRTRTPITDPGDWDATWARVYELRKSDPTKGYECSHSVTYGR